MKILSTILLASVAAKSCTSGPPSPINIRRSGDAAGATQTPNTSTRRPDQPETPIEVSAPTIPDFPTEILIENNKFKGQENRFEAVVKYAGAISEKIRLDSTENATRLIVPDLVSGKSDALVIEIYEGTTIRFKATKLATTLDRTKANTVEFKDCDIQKLPWSGQENETLCSWYVSDVES